MTEREIRMENNNAAPASILKNMALAAFGLFLFGIGVYLTIQANIGVAPWDAFNLGLSSTFDIQYGTASIIVSFTIIAIDLLLRERIGVGTIFDAVITGKTVDLCNWLNIVPAQESLWSGLAIMIAGLFIMGFSQFIYMKAALCCGPRDALLVALGKRFHKLPIGAVSICILCVVLFIGWQLGGPIGIGTVVAALGTGPAMQLSFMIVKFKPIEVVHQDIFTTLKILFGGANTTNIEGKEKAGEKTKEYISVWTAEMDEKKERVN